MPFAFTELKNETVDACRRWRLIHLLGISVLRGRYARSSLGQFWIGLSAGLFIVAIGLCWSLIWHRAVHEFLPYFGIGQILFTFFSGSINGSRTVLTGDVRYYTNDKLPYMVSVLALVYRNAVILLHDVVVIVLLLIYGILYGGTVKLAFLPTLLPAFVLAMVFIVFSSYVMAVVCTRFRDLGHIVGIAMQSLYLFTPVIWRLDNLPEMYRNWVFLNPFASLLELTRNPLLGIAPNPVAYLSLALWSAAVVGLAGWVHARYNRNLIFWI